MLSDEKILKILQECGLIRRYNYYFTGVLLPSFGQYALLGVFAPVLNHCSGYILNYTEEGIGVIPLDSFTGEPMKTSAIFIPKERIKEIKIENANILYYKKIIITDIDNQSILITTMKKVLTVKKHKENLQKFIDDFSKR